VAERAVADDPFGTRGCDGTGDGVEMAVATVQMIQVLCDGPFPGLRSLIQDVVNQFYGPLRFSTGLDSSQ
jgi:hypothetical protein